MLTKETITTASNAALDRKSFSTARFREAPSSARAGLAADPVAAALVLAPWPPSPELDPEQLAAGPFADIAAHGCRRSQGKLIKKGNGLAQSKITLTRLPSLSLVAA